MTETTATTQTNKITPPKPTPTKKSGAKFATSLAFLAVLLAGGSAYYTYWQQQQTQQILQAAKDDQNTQLQDQLTQIQNNLALTTQQVLLQKTQLTAQQKQIQELASSLNRTDPNWLLEEINYIVHVANFNVLYQHNPEVALALLQVADRTLLKISDPALIPVHQALRSDINQLVSLPAINKENLLNRINALSIAVSQLPAANLEANAQPLTVTTATPATTWWQKAWQNTLNKIASFIKVRHVGEETPPVLNHVAQAYVKQDLQILLTQAQLAAMQPNNALYQLSLKQIQNITQQYFDIKVAEVNQFLENVQQLALVNVAPTLPPLTNSMNALNQALTHLANKPVATPSAPQPATPAATTSTPTPAANAAPAPTATPVAPATPATTNETAAQAKTGVAL